MVNTHPVLPSTVKRTWWLCVRCPCIFSYISVPQGSQAPASLSELSQSPTRLKSTVKQFFLDVFKSQIATYLKLPQPFQTLRNLKVHAIESLHWSEYQLWNVKQVYHLFFPTLLTYPAAVGSALTHWHGTRSNPIASGFVWTFSYLFVLFCLFQSSHLSHTSKTFFHQVGISLASERLGKNKSRIHLSAVTGLVT